MAISSVFVELKASIGEFQAKMGEAKGELQKLEKKGGSTSAKLQAAGKGLATGFVGVAVAVGGFGLEMADQYEKAHATLETAVRNSGSSIDALKGPIGSTEKSLEKFGFTNTQVEDALASLTTATNNPKKALSEMGLAANIAAARHISLQDATNLLGKALAGNLRPLKQMGIDLPVTAGGAYQLQTATESLHTAQMRVNQILAKTPDAANAASKAHNAYESAMNSLTNAQTKYNETSSTSNVIIDTLSQRFGGAAATQADTFAGKMAALKAQAQDAGKNIGMKLIPILEKLMSITEKLVDWLSKHKMVAAALAVVIGGVVVAAFVAWAAAAVTAAAGTIAATAPVLLIIAAVGLMVYAIMDLVKHWKTVWANLKKYADEAWQWLQDNVLKPVEKVFEQYVLQPIQTVFQNVERIWTDYENAVLAVWNAVKHYIDDGINFIKKIPTEIADAVKDIFNIFTQPFRKAWDFISQIPNKIGNALSHIPGAGLLKHIPGFAVGTTYAPGGLALVGEQGPELVQLPRGSQVQTATQTQQTLGAMAQQSAQPTTTNNYTINVNIPHGVSPLRAAEAFSAAIDRRERAFAR